MQRKNDSSLWRTLRATFVVAVLAVLVMSCDLDDDRTPTPAVPVSYLSIYHASPDAPGLDILVDETTINTNPFDYTDYSGYLNFRTGSRHFTLRAANAANTIIDTTFNFVEGKAYSLFVADRLASIEAILLEDKAEQPAPGNAMVRFVHLSPDASAVDITAENLEDISALKGKGFKQASQFVEVDANRYSFQVKAAGTDDVLLSSDKIDLQSGGFYTILLRGFANPADGVTNVLSLEVL